MKFIDKINTLFKNAFNEIKLHGFRLYGEKILNIAICCLIVISIFCGPKDIVFPYIYQEKYRCETSDIGIKINQEIYPFKDDLKKMLSKSKLISWDDARNTIKDNGLFYLYDLKSNGTCINMKKISQQSLYNAVPYGKEDFKILNSILNDKRYIERRGCIIEYNNSYYIASYEVNKNYSLINIHFIDSKNDKNMIDGLHQNEIYKVLNYKEAI